MLEDDVIVPPSDDAGLSAGGGVQLFGGSVFFLRPAKIATAIAIAATTTTRARIDSASRFPFVAGALANTITTLTFWPETVTGTDEGLACHPEGELTLNV